jgi:cellulose 1,4-beta-cellobiosidase
MDSFPVAVLLCAVACSVLPLRDAGATTYVMDDRWDTTSVLAGEYRVFNNVWGAETAQEVTGDTNSTAFEVTLSEHDNSSVAAYPFILKGIHWGDAPTATVGSGLPTHVEDVASAPFQWSIDTSTANGSWNAAFESFFSSAGGMAPDKAELMIWVNYEGVYAPGGTRVASNVSIGGLNWNVYHGSPWASWQHYIAYQLVTPSNSESLDLRDFMDDALSRGYLASSWYLDNMEAGFEIWRDGEGLKTNSFSAEVIRVPVLPGDYNEDGRVDAADYTVWRDALGRTETLPNDDTQGVGQDDYTRWKDHYGQAASGAGAGAQSGSQVPEASSIHLAFSALAALVALADVAFSRSSLHLFGTKMLTSRQHHA